MVAGTKRNWALFGRLGANSVSFLVVLPRRICIFGRLTRRSKVLVNIAGLTGQKGIIDHTNTQTEMTPERGPQTVMCKLVFLCEALLSQALVLQALLMQALWLHALVLQVLVLQAWPSHF